VYNRNAFLSFPGDKSEAESKEGLPRAEG
jgi:hypothetical protein